MGSKKRSKIGARNKRIAYVQEKRVADRLSERLGGEFYPTPRSGGLRWKEREDTIGDVVTPKWFPFTIECKHSKEVCFLRLFDTRGPNTSKDFISWWGEACENALRSGKTPMLVVGKSHRKDLVVVPQDSIPTFALLEFSIKAHITLDITQRDTWEYVTILYMDDLIEKLAEMGVQNNWMKMEENSE